MPMKLESFFISKRFLSKIKKAAIDLLLISYKK